MSDQNKNDIIPYIRLPRSLLVDHKWLNLPSFDKEVYIVLVTNAQYHPFIFDDFGLKVDLQVGQLCKSHSEIASLCGPPTGKKKPNIKNVENSLTRLRRLQLVGWYVGRQRMIITITHSDTYAMFLEVHGKADGKDVGKSWETIKQRRIKKDKNNKTKVFLSDSIEIGLCVFFSDYLKSFLKNPRIPVNFQSWAKHFYQMLSTDERKPDEIKAIITWLRTNEFWRKNVLSPEKLRNQFDRLTLETQSKDKKYEKRSGDSTATNEEYRGKRYQKFG